ncbi:MAG TPA: hypothetical protein DCO77_03645 [Nitrospiraceae bacterium]|nr:hypothetical protein [Nitrospiraceae bacterium]
MAVDGSGNAVAVWDQSDGTRDNIWANRYVPGFGWGTAVLIETDNAGHAYYPQVAVDGSGNAVVVWNQSDGTRDSTWSNRYEVGTGWGTAMLIESDNAGDASNVQVAVDGSGNAVAVWYQSDGTRDSTWANRYVVGTGWGSAMLIESDNAGDASNVQVAVDGSGNAVAVWQQSDGTRTNIWANRYVVGTGWGSTALIETANVGSAFSPQVAVDGSGNAVAVWQQSDGTRYNIWANRFVAGDDSGSFIPESSFLGIWMRQDGSNAGIYGKEYLGDGTGYLGNFSSGPFERATPFTWSLSGNVSTEDRFAAIYHEEIVYLEGADMEQRREEDGKTRVWRKQ